MNEKLLAIIVCVGIAFGVVAIPEALLFAQSKESDPEAAIDAAAPEIIIEGAVQEIAADKSYIVVNGAKIITESDFFGYSDIMVGKTLAIFAEKTDHGLVAVDCVSMGANAVESLGNTGRDSSQGVEKGSEK